MMHTEALILARLAKPITHEVVTVYADGSEKRHGTRNIAQAENFATGERRKIGRDLIARKAGKAGNAVLVIAVNIVAI